MSCAGLTKLRLHIVDNPFAIFFFSLWINPVQQVRYQYVKSCFRSTFTITNGRCSASFMNLLKKHLLIGKEPINRVSAGMTKRFKHSEFI